MKFKTSLLAGGFLALTAIITAQAQTVVWQDDYEGQPAGTDVFAWGGGSITNYSVTIAAGVGVGGTQGLEYSFDTTVQYDGYMSVNMGYSGGNPSGNTSANLSDYVLSFDIASDGGVTLNSLQLNIQGWADQWFGGAMTETGAGDIDVSSATVGSGFHNISVNLGTFDGDASLDPTSQTYQFQWQVNAWQLDGGGPVTGQQVVIDNAKITMVPEPTTFALLGLGGALLAIRRRRI